MRAFASSLHAWKHLERQEGVKVPHDLTFPLAVVRALGEPHGLVMDAEERVGKPGKEHDAVFVSVMDSRCMVETAQRFRAWSLPMRRSHRDAGMPLVWAGGQGLHNPMPYAHVADLIVIGDAESPLPSLLDLWERHGNSQAFLSHAATVPGVYVPTEHDPSEATVVQSVADDISVTMRHQIVVSNNGSRRVEIARGCRFKCTFCSLGWRAPLRENTGEQVVSEIGRSPKQVHLQAGDAESHSEIGAIRSALKQHGGFDSGWTGRMDTLFDNPDQTIPGQKRYAFGVEGVSFRLRRAVGKGYLTDERLVSDTCRFFDAIECDVDTRGRAAWHVIAGLPTERMSETRDLMRVIMEIDRRRSGKTRRNLAIHWQPFSPLPGTPMQWCAAGDGARRQASTLRPLEGLDWVGVRQLGGRTDRMAQVCTSLARADADGGLVLLEALGRGAATPEYAAETAGSAGALDPDAPLPWDWIQHAYPRQTLRRAYDVMLRRLDA